MRALKYLSIVLGFSALLPTPAGAQPAKVNELDVTMQPQPIDDQTQADELSLRKDRFDRMTVAVDVGGLGPFRFMVDTGADRTAISSAVAARLGLEAGNAVSLHSISGISTIGTATVPNLQVSKTSLRIVDAPVLNADEIGADGILGTDSLRSKRVMFDFEKNVMTVVPSTERVVPSEDGTVVVTGKLKNGRLIVTNAIAEGRKIVVVLDTGSEVSLGNDALRRRLARDHVETAGHVQLQSVTGEMILGEYTFVKKLTIGDVTLGNLAVVFTDAHTFKALGLKDKPALLLGMNALRVFKKVSIDFANKKLRVMLPETGELDRLMLAAR